MKKIWMLAGLVLWGCGQQAATPVIPPEEPAQAADVSLKPEALKVAGVSTEAVAKRAVQTGLEVPGTVSIPANARAVVTPPVAGKVVRLFAGVGDRVRKGQALAEIESGDLAQAASAIAGAETLSVQAAGVVRQELAAVDLAKGRLRTAQANLDRQRRFASAGAFSQPSLTAARNELSEAQRELLSAQAEEEAHIVQLARVERLNKEGLVSLNDLEAARLERRQDELRLSRARNRVDSARQTYDREQRIERQGLANSREVGTADAEVRSAKLELDQAQIQLQGAKAALSGAQRAVQNARASASAIRGGGSGSGSRVTLTAPISGVVTERQATLGQAVERSSDLFDLEDASVVWVTANVPEGELAQVRQGAAVTVTTSAYPGRSFAGRVEVIGSRLDAKTRSLPVQCRVENAEGALRADLFARVRLTTGKSIFGLAVPVSAVVEEKAVFVESGAKFEKREVKVGRSDGRFVQIIEGLKSGEKIAVSGVFTLQSELRKSELKEDE